MELNRRFHDVMLPMADPLTVEQVCMGIGYTAVVTSDGGVGVAYTYLDAKSGCCMIQDYQDFEGRPARDLLALIQHPEPLERSMALALINALNRDRAAQLPEDKQNALLFDALAIRAGTKVSMVGYIKPTVGALESMGARVDVIDEFRQMGDKDRFLHQLATWADAALITSTTILNNTLESILDRAAEKVRIALLGPSTPMVAEAFKHRPMVKALAGIVPGRIDPVLKTVRHGLGTRHLHRCSRKVTLSL
ncbi:MAG: DUF364 domain-containing protein [Desulfobacteraceae bacterium]|jgi:uncharacterized protein (DUF4213/DUF364 family)